MGKGSGSGGARGGGGGGKTVSEQTFSAKDLKGGKDRIGEATTSENVRQYADRVAQSVRPGDKVTVEKHWKDGTVTKETYTVTTSEKTWRDGSTTTEYNAKVNGRTSEGFFGSPNRSQSMRGSGLSKVISEGRSKVKSVKVTHTTKKKR